MARIEVILQPEQYDLQDEVLKLSNDAQHPTPRSLDKVMIISLPASVDTTRLDELGIRYKEVSSPGRPVEPVYQGVARKPITIQWPVELISAIDKLTNNRTKWLIEAAEMRLSQERGS
jgi:hypothetical protein